MNNIDNTRLDLVIPGQQHMYLRAPSPQERQKWLVALGSAKACVDSKEINGNVLTLVVSCFYLLTGFINQAFKKIMTHLKHSCIIRN